MKLYFQYNQWVSYDDIEMVGRKADFINDNGFGGAMIWDLASDDFNNLCGQGRYPLIRTISENVKTCTAPPPRK